MEAAQFIVDYNGNHLLSQRDGGQDLYFLADQARSFFETVKKDAFAKVDIKGQI